MDFKVNLSPVAIGDLEAIVAPIAKDNPDAALKFGDAQLTRTFRLASMPEMGRIFCTRKGRVIREWVFKSYRIFYSVYPETKLIEVHRIWHGAREEPKLTDEG
jgi:toxin ParE1/3/4